VDAEAVAVGVAVAAVVDEEAEAVGAVDEAAPSSKKSI
jgi:hypothetical protein